MSFDLPIRLALSCGVGLKEIGRLGVTDRALQIRRAGAGRPPRPPTGAN